MELLPTPGLGYVPMSAPPAAFPFWTNAAESLPSSFCASATRPVMSALAILIAVSLAVQVWPVLSTRNSPVELLAQARRLPPPVGNAA
jgi:hypothetical protein